MSTTFGITFPNGVDAKRSRFCAPLLMARTIALTALLSGCDDSSADKAQLATTNLRVTTLEERVNALSDDLAKTKAELATARLVALNASSATESIRKTVNANVQTANRNTLNDMTRRGACGTEAVPAGNGGYVFANKRCELKDLAP